MYMDDDSMLKYILLTIVSNINNKSNKKIDDNICNLFWKYNLQNVYKNKKLLGNFISQNTVGYLYDFDKEYSKLFQSKIKDLSFDKKYKELKKNGYTLLENKLNSQLCDKIVDLTKNCNYIIHESNTNNKLKWIKNQDDVLLNDTNSIISDIAFDPYFIKIAQLYLKTNPIFLQSNLWITEFNDQGKKESNTQKFHQDYDDFSFVKIFIYLTDVTEDNGPHRYIKSSLNDLKVPENYKPSTRLTDKFISENYKDQVIEFLGEKGTILIEDTHGFHSGSEVKKGKRIILQLQYGVSNYCFINHNYPKSNLQKNDYMKKYPISFLKFKD